MPGRNNLSTSTRRMPSDDARTQRILMLQGPVGPFFQHLQAFLVDEGHDVSRVCFNAGDLWFSSPQGRVRFPGGAEQWQGWIESQLGSGGYDSMILFGSERPAHRVAIETARRCGVRTISLEEGYMRPGFITVEEGGNNAGSPAAGLLPPPEYEPPATLAPPATGDAFRAMLRAGTLYYAVRGFCTHGRQRELFHRDTPLLRESFFWCRNYIRRLRGSDRDYALVQRLLEHHDGGYYLVPLQVDADANLKRAALGWTTARLVSEAILSFARAAPEDRRLAFKIHPMERGHNRLTPMIRDLAAAEGVADRVDVIETGSLGLIARHSAGMITINSTSGLSAIAHGVPLMVLGDALYANDRLALCLRGLDGAAKAFDGFWEGGRVAAPDLRTRYLAWIRETCLRPGDFYSAAGMETACASIADHLDAVPEAAGLAAPFRVLRGGRA